MPSAATPPSSHVDRMVATRFGQVRCVVSRVARHGEPAALLVHGVGAGAHVWNPVLPLLRNVWAVAIDLPGHGRSQGPLPDTAEDYALCLDEVRIALDLPKVFAVGQSMGGAVVQCYARAFAASCEGIVIANSAVDFAIGQERLQRMVREWPAATRDFAARQVSRGASEALKEEARRLVSLRDPRVLVHDLRTCNAFSSRGWAGQVSVPVMVVTGDEDQSYGPVRALELKAVFPQAELHVLDHCGHNAVLEQPQALAALLNGFAVRCAPLGRAGGVA